MRRRHQHRPISRLTARLRPGAAGARRQRPGRRLAAVGSAVLVSIGAGADPALATTGENSNWAGYVAQAPGVHFTGVSASWVQPSVSCTPGSPSYVSSWVGLGGHRTPVLEQIGTEADCAADGSASYSVWYELVPTVSATPALVIGPGDVISVSVTVGGRRVRLHLADVTRGTAVTRQLDAGRVDVSSAEWIVEAPVLCFGAMAASCQDSTLADFGATGFFAARATASGRSGPVSDPRWSATAYTLDPAGPPRGQARPADRVARAVPGALSSAGDAFGVGFGTAPPAAGGRR
ncbi:MAG: hypothetical protein QOF77_2103 [Solirubrobacteraceae bacterium]|jgi:hypothetical protein|nr:hypothetical protein [Solirubrobacteraceae bacterium]